MISDIVESITGVAVLGMLSLFIFLFFFLAVLYWVFRADKKYITKMKNMPLDASTMNGDLNHD